MGNKTKVSVIGLEGADMQMRVSLQLLHSEHDIFCTCCTQEFMLFENAISLGVVSLESLAKMWLVKTKVDLSRANGAQWCNDTISILDIYVCYLLTLPSTLPLTFSKNGTDAI